MVHQNRLKFYEMFQIFYFKLSSSVKSTLWFEILNCFWIGLSIIFLLNKLNEDWETNHSTFIFIHHLHLLADQDKDI